MLEQLAPDVWVINGSCVNFYGFAYPTRSVVIRLSDGSMWFWSPIKFDAALASEITAIGPISYLVSPNKIHHLFLSEWQAHFPDAQLWGPQSTIDKRNDLSFDGVLTDCSPKTWCDEIMQFHITGSLAMDEVLFLHKASETLIMADFSEHFSEDFLKANWRPWQRWIARRWGIVEGKGFAPLEWRLSFLQRHKLRQVKKYLLSLPIQRVIMAHGSIVEENVHDFLRRSLAWV